MNLDSESTCRAYVEGQLAQLKGKHPGWNTEFSPTWHDPTCHLRSGRVAWNVTRSDRNGSYTLEVRPDDREFVVWFGNHQVGAEGLHWIMRPAVHVAFTDLAPRRDPVGLPFTLCDVLEQMIATVDRPSPGPRFELNDFSLT